MAWTPAGTIQLTRDWQYTDPIATGSYFRLKHAEARNGDLFAVAQCEVDSEGNLSIGDTQVLAVEKGISDVIKLPKTAYTDRRIAIKRITSQPSLEQEIRRLFLPNFLIPPEQEIRFIRRNNWSVIVEVSDYIEPTPTQTDYSTEFADITTRLTTIEQKIDSLGSTTNGTESSTTNGIDLFYVNDGQFQGVFYYLGTEGKTTTFSNPSTTNKINIFATPRFTSGYEQFRATDRISSSYYLSEDVENAYYGVDLINYTLIIKNYYISYQYDYDVLQNWKFQGSNDQPNWIDLDTQVNNTTIRTQKHYLGQISTTQKYRYFRILHTGLNNSNTNILSLTELEIYGTLIQL